jgi:hypothetical protein
MKILETIIAFFNNLFKSKKSLKNSQDLRQSFQLVRLEAENQKLREKIRLDEGSWELIKGRRVYERDENQGQFEQKRHLNLGGICLQELKEGGLNAVRTVRQDPLGDIAYSSDGSVEDKSKLQQIFAKLQSKYNPEQ